MSDIIKLPSEMRGEAVKRLSSRKRYYLHRCIKKIEGAAVYAKRKQISITHDLYDSLSPPRRSWIDQLKVDGYNIQTQIK